MHEEETLDRLDRLQPIIILAFAVIGLFAGRIEWISEHTEGLEDPFLMILLFLIFLDIDWKDVLGAFKDYKFTLKVLTMNFLWTPIFAFILSKTVLSGQHALQLALILMLVMPCTDWYLIFTGMAGGNLALSSALLPIQLVLQLLLLPVYLGMFFHGGAQINVLEILIEVFSVAFIPFVLSMIFKFFFKRYPAFEKMENFMDDRGELLESAVMSLIVFTVFASEGQGIFENPYLYPRMLLAMAIYYPVNFILVMAFSRKMPVENRISFLFAATARNTPLSLSLGALIFPNEPLVALACLIGPLTELPVLVIERAVILKLFGKHKHHELENEV